jgi:hypothetical protein
MISLTTQHLHPFVQLDSKLHEHLLWFATPGIREDLLSCWESSPEAKAIPRSLQRS